MFVMLHDDVRSPLLCGSAMWKLTSNAATSKQLHTWTVSFKQGAEVHLVGSILWKKIKNFTTDFWQYAALSFTIYFACLLFHTTRFTNSWSILKSSGLLPLSAARARYDQSAKKRWSPQPGLSSDKKPVQWQPTMAAAVAAAAAAWMLQWQQIPQNCTTFPH